MRHNYIRLNGIARINKIQIICLLVFFGSIFTKISSQETESIKSPYLETTAIVDTLVEPDRFYLNIKVSEATSKDRISTEDVEIKMNSKLKELGLNLKDQVALIKVTSKYRFYFLRKTQIYKEKEYSILTYDIETANQVIIELESIGISNIVLNKVEFSKASDLKIKLREKAMEKAIAQAELTVLPLNQKINKAIFISDSNGVAGNIISNINTQHRNLGCYSYYVNRYDIKLGLKMNMLRISNSIFVKFDLDQKIK